MTMKRLRPEPKNYSRPKISEATALSIIPQVLAVVLAIVVTGSCRYPRVVSLVRSQYFS